MDFGFNVRRDYEVAIQRAIAAGDDDLAHYLSVGLREWETLYDDDE